MIAMRNAGRKLLYLIITCELICKGKTYQVKYHDCSNPKTIGRYDALEACNGEGKKESSEEKFIQFLAPLKVKDTEGVRCYVKASVLTYFCGAWSHLKVAAVPKISEPRAVTPSQCESMLHERVYRDPMSGQTHAVEMNKQNYFSIINHGMFTTESDNVRCNGVTFTYEQELFQDAIQIQIMQVELTSERYRILDNVIETTSDHLTLPCNPSSESCVTAMGTYIWTVPRTECPFQAIRTLPMKQILGTHLINEENQILVNQTSLVPTSCNGRIYGTNFKDLYLTIDKLDIPPIRSMDLNIETFELAKLSYLTYKIEERMIQQSNDFNTFICTQSAEQTNKLVRWENEKYLFRKADIIYHISCETKTSTIRELEYCTTNIPIEDRNGYVDPTNQAFVNHSSKTLCNSHYPLVIKSLNGWVKLDPNAIPVAAPANGHLRTMGDFQLDEVNSRGLYTATELENWNRLIAFPAYKQALLARFSVGNCVGSGLCAENHPQENLPRYDIENLVRSASSNLNLLTYINDFIVTNAAYISAAALVLISIKTLINLCIIMMTLYRAGPAAVIVILGRIFCSSTRHYNKMVHASRRKAYQEADVPLDPLT